MSAKLYLQYQIYLLAHPIKKVSIRVDPDNVKLRMNPQEMENQIKQDFMIERMITNSDLVMVQYIGDLVKEHQ